MSRRFKHLTSLCLLPLALTGLFSCSSSVHHIEYVYAYGTNWEIHLYEGKQEDAEEISSYISKTSQLLDLDARHSKNGLYALNHEEQVQADPFLLEALELGQQIEGRSHGAFSITIGALTKAWLEKLESGSVLDQASVSSLLEEAKSTKVVVDGSIAKREGNGTIDLGAIGKGLCLNHVKSWLDEKGFTKYLINGGSSSLLIGENSSEKGTTKVNLADAKGRYFEVKNVAISNSAVSRQRYEIDGHTYSHIVDARNGVPEVFYDALCIAGKDAGLLDGLSTAYLILGQENVSELEKEGIQAAFMKGGEVVYATSGFLS